MFSVPVLKKYLSRIPYPMGVMISQVPYSWRPGMGFVYRRRRHEMLEFDAMEQEQKRKFIFHRFHRLVSFAIDHVPFYRDHYTQNGFSIDQLRGFDDIDRVPRVTKADLRDYDLEQRSAEQSGRYMENTGGSSGSPLSFYIMPQSIPHEWAHMHRIWSKLGYRQSDLKLCFGGRNLQERAVGYDGLRHHYAVSIYAPYEQIATELKRILRRRYIRYLHGYPSALHDFACFCRDHDNELAARLRDQLEGAFLGSEYPSPAYRQSIESVFDIQTVSWYGHTERAVLAWERNEPYVYEPFGSYGYAEAVVDADTGMTKLVGTSYYNFASPFIRYDTGDEIGIVCQDEGLLEAFSIEGGREGDYVLDENGKRISLTGLIFGRHHRVFDVAKFIQVEQTHQGLLTIVVTPRSELTPDQASAMFDVSGIRMRFEFRIVTEPIKTLSGKVVLRIHKDDRKP